MISRAEIRKFIDEVEREYQKCWMVLSALKEGPFLEEMVKELFEFQPTLAAALFRLDEMYRLLLQEKHSLINKKSRLNPRWFRLTMRTLAEYQEAIKRVIAIGRALGDSFAWIFYEKDRELLLKHLKHERIPHTPPGIGGRGELEFIRGVKVIDQRFVLYHGITTFLRVSDFSLIDLKNRTVTAIGEIKTTRSGPNELLIHFSLISPKPFRKRRRTSARPSNSEPEHELSPQQAQVLKRQLNNIAAAFSHRKPDEKITSRHNFHFDALGRFAAGLKKKSVVFEKAGEGLMLVGLKSPRAKSLSAKLLGKSRVDMNKRLVDVPRQAIQLIDMEQAKQPNNINSLLIGGLDLETLMGTTPMFWWPVPVEFLRQVFFKDVVVLTLYNPAHLARKLRGLGFEVELIGKGQLKVRKVMGDKVFEMQGMDYFLNSIQRSLITEDATVELFAHLLGRIESGALTVNTRVELQMQQFLSRL